MFAELVVPFLHRMFGHVLQVGIGRTVSTMRVGEGFGEIGLREAKEFFFVKLVWLVF